MADEEWKYINAEKEKFLDENQAAETKINFEMLKIAQSIDKEVIRAKKLWEEVDSDAGSEEVGIRVTTSK